MQNEGVEQAINRVLRAETEARGAAEECKRKAHRLVDDARAQARRILERADLRISAMHSACNLAASRKIAQFETEARALAQQPPTPEPAQLRQIAAAAGRLAGELTGA
jgi:hypothetical protein